MRLTAEVLDRVAASGPSEGLADSLAAIGVGYGIDRRIPAPVLDLLLPRSRGESRPAGGAMSAVACVLAMGICVAIANYTGVSGVALFGLAVFGPLAGLIIARAITGGRAPTSSPALTRGLHAVLPGPLSPLAVRAAVEPCVLDGERGRIDNTIIAEQVLRAWEVQLNGLARQLVDAEEEMKAASAILTELAALPSGATANSAVHRKLLSEVQREHALIERLRDRVGQRLQEVLALREATEAVAVGTTLSGLLVECDEAAHRIREGLALLERD